MKAPDLDATRWSPARLPLPTGELHVPLDPNAELVVDSGEVRVTIPRFSLSHDRFQAVDSAKHLTVSTDEFALPPDRPATFAVDLAVENFGGDPADYRRAMAAFHVFDLASSKRVFAVVGTATRVLAMHEHLGLAVRTEPFYHVIESPYADFDDDFTRPRTCEITLDRSTLGRDLERRRPDDLRGPWHLDPRTRADRVRDLDDAADPGRRSRSLDGQGISARWPGSACAAWRRRSHEHRSRTVDASSSTYPTSTAS